MIRGSDLVGLPVLADRKLLRIGRVQEVLLSADGDRICGLVLDAGGWLRPRRVLDFGAVHALGPTHVLAAERYLTEGTPSLCCRDLLGLPVLTATGNDLGALDDFRFDPADGRIMALQLSQGLVDDLFQGKLVFPLVGPVTAGADAILVAGPDADPGAVDLSGGALS